jgi:hypothetical protein
MALLYPYSLYPHCNIDTPPFSRGFFSFPDLHFGWLELDGPRCCEHSDISDYHSLTDETNNESQHGASLVWNVGGFHCLSSNASSLSKMHGQLAHHWREHSSRYHKLQ